MMDGSEPKQEFELSVYGVDLGSPSGDSCVITEANLGAQRWKLDPPLTVPRDHLVSLGAGDNPGDLKIRVWRYSGWYLSEEVRILKKPEEMKDG